MKDDVLAHMAEYVRLGQDSALLKEAAQPSDVNSYSALFVRMLGSLYRDLKPHSPIFLNGLIARRSDTAWKPDVSWLGRGQKRPFNRLIYDQSRETLRTIRVVRYYEGNVILIVKPNRLRYWIRSTAVEALRRHGCSAARMVTMAESHRAYTLPAISRIGPPKGSTVRRRSISFKRSFPYGVMTRRDRRTLPKKD